MKKRIIIIISIILLIITIILTATFLCINTYTIHYNDSQNSYDIILKNNKVIVKANTVVLCIKDPCPKQKHTYKIQFNEEHMKKINKFLKKQLNNNKEVSLTREELNEEDLNVMNSIIYNEEQLLEEEKISENSYKIITDFKLKTTQNDGGSFTSIYYIIDPENNKVYKREENYKAPTKEHNDTLIYKKTLDDDYINSIKEKLDTVMSDISLDSDNYYFYTIEHTNITSYIYNKEEIKILEDVLLDIDYY